MCAVSALLCSPCKSCDNCMVRFGYHSFFPLAPPSAWHLRALHTLRTASHIVCHIVRSDFSLAQNLLPFARATNSASHCECCYCQCHYYLLLSLLSLLLLLIFVVIFHRMLRLSEVSFPHFSPCLCVMFRFLPISRAQCRVSLLVLCVGVSCVINFQAICVKLQPRRQLSPSLSVSPQVQRTHAGVCKKFGIIWKIGSLLTSDTRAHIRKLSRVGRRGARSVCLIEQ